MGLRDAEAGARCVAIMAAKHKNAPPSPKGLPLIGLFREYRRDFLGMLLRAAREHGDVVRLPVGPRTLVLLNHPDYIEQVLVREQHKFVKGGGIEVTRRLLGQGLLTSEGEFWRRQRRLAQPAFHRARVMSYGQTMVDYTLRHLESWQDGDRRDIGQEMMQLTLAIALKTLFDADVESDAREIGQALSFLMKYAVGRFRSLVKVPESWPTPRNRRAERAYRYLDSVVYRIIESRRRSGEDRGALLSMLIHATDEDGSQMTPQQLRDETMTIFLAGHETTALALTWTWYLLSENVQAEAQLHSELDRVLGGRQPSADDLERLPYLDAVVHESMRLYPPAYAVVRRALEPFEVGGYAFPAGTQLLLSPWAMHRDPRYYDQPEEFRPERWLDGSARRLPAYAYFPFGGGPRRCIGQSFALMEAALVVATIAQRFALRLAPRHPVVPEPLITLRPKYGVVMTISGRRRAA